MKKYKYIMISLVFCIFILVGVQAQTNSNSKESISSIKPVIMTTNSKTNIVPVKKGVHTNMIVDKENTVSSNKVDMEQTSVFSNMMKKEEVNLKEEFSVEILSRDHFYLNEVPKLSASVKKQDVSLKELEIICKITTPKEKLIEVKLLDKGTSGDLKVGDGVYTAYVIPYLSAGPHKLDFHIKAQKSDKDIDIVHSSVFTVKGYMQIPVKVEPSRLDYRSGQPGVKNTGGFQLSSRLKKPVRVLNFTTSLICDNEKIPAWKIKASPFSLKVYPGRTRRVDVYVTPDQYNDKGVYKGYVILDMINHAVKLPVSFEIVENKNITVWRRMTTSANSSNWIIYVLSVLITAAGVYYYYKSHEKKSLSFERLITDNGDSRISCSLDKDEVTLGRDHENDLELFDSNVSRKHAVIHKKGANYVLTDNNSTNGTFINGKKIKEKIIKKGDIILIGKFKIKVA